MRIFEQHCRELYLTQESMEKIEKLTNRELKKVGERQEKLEQSIELLSR